MRLKVRIFNNEGGGIGKRLIWRVNGQTAGDTEPAALQALADRNGPVTVTQSLKLDPTRENIVTVTAYNGAGLLATLPLRYKIDRFGATPVGEARPRMFILAVGVDGYSDPALTPLKLAVGDVEGHLAANSRPRPREAATRRPRSSSGWKAMPPKTRSQRHLPTLRPASSARMR